MKKSIITSLVLASGLVLAACGNDADQTEKESSASEQTDSGNTLTKT